MRAGVAAEADGAGLLFLVPFTFPPSRALLTLACEAQVLSKRQSALCRAMCSPSPSAL